MFTITFRTSRDRFEIEATLRSLFVRIPGIGEGMFGGSFPAWSWWSEVKAAEMRLRASWAAEAA